MDVLGLLAAVWPFPFALCPLPCALVVRVESALTPEGQQYRQEADHKPGEHDALDQGGAAGATRGDGGVKHVEAVNVGSLCDPRLLVFLRQPVARVAFALDLALELLVLGGE